METQRKIVGHELRATEAIQNAMRRLQSSSDDKKKDVTFSILNQVIVDYLGYRAIVTAIPITQFGDDIEDGTNDTEHVGLISQNSLNFERTTRDDPRLLDKMLCFVNAQIEDTFFTSIMSHHLILWTRSMTR